MLPGCAHQAREITPPVHVPAGFSEGGTAQVAESWWTAFDSPELDALIEEAIHGNLDVRIAWERLQEARALSDRASSGLWPTLDADALAATRRPAFATEDQLQLGLSAGYELDLWGRIRSASQAEALRAEASAADYQTALISVSAEVARTAFQTVISRQQVTLLEEQLEANEQVLELLENRFGSGQIRRVDILRQRQLVESTREQLLSSTADLRVFEHQLAVLLGKAPTEAEIELPDELPGLPELPRTGVPADLVQRRPDLSAAYARLMAADRDLATAVANRFPRLSLSASVSTEENDAVDLFDDWIRNLAASLVVPIVDGGERRAEVRRRESLKQQRLFEYGRAILESLREVEDALVLEASQIRRLDSLEEQVRLAGASLEQLRREYINGISDYLDVLTALTDEQRLRRDLLSTRLALYEFRIALYRALAGPLTSGRANP
jgi:NodT family efflux transporter outer membrane factor (OMF) lipoprotein